jgi:hypothetical protein
MRNLYEDKSNRKLSSHLNWFEDIRMYFETAPLNRDKIIFCSLSENNAIHFSLRVLRFEYLIKNEHVQILRVNIEIFHGFLIF